MANTSNETVNVSTPPAAETPCGIIIFNQCQSTTTSTQSKTFLLEVLREVVSQKGNCVFPETIGGCWRGSEEDWQHTGRVSFLPASTTIPAKVIVSLDSLSYELYHTRYTYRFTSSGGNIKPDRKQKTRGYIHIPQAPIGRPT
ncbi:hypothetical protein ZHAS_00014698 [Anopheles sinensis]|uniref:Uncharacterized protein n=1 Tax=Anopheles sinensis TaxID=74873 RepID=A0A084W908_ANOSI|nr:hypothetical protein ZHAS_00014698 [Anopheles sinensis]